MHVVIWPHYPRVLEDRWRQLQATGSIYRRDHKPGTQIATEATSFRPAPSGFPQTLAKPCKSSMSAMLTGMHQSRRRSDEEIWRIFRKPLERRNLISTLKPKRITAPDYDYDFKNEVWHVYEPVSFDLIEPNSLLEKANRWLGRSAGRCEAFCVNTGSPSNQPAKAGMGKPTSLLGRSH